MLRKQKSKTDSYVLYPEYFNKNLSKTEGRRLPLDQCIENPSLAELRLAAERLGLNFDLLQEAAYPRQWWNKNGLIRIDRNEKNKTEILQLLGKTMKDVIRPALERKSKELELLRDKKKGKSGLKKGPQDFSRKIPPSTSHEKQKLKPSKEKRIKRR